MSSGHKSGYGLGAKKRLAGEVFRHTVVPCVMVVEAYYVKSAGLKQVIARIRLIVSGGYRTSRVKTAHNIGQIAVACLVLESASLLYYLPALLAAGTAAGCVIGCLGGIVVERLSRYSSFL